MDWIVTGASRGIGRALVLALAREGTAQDRVFALARDAARLRDLVDAASASPVRVATLSADLSRVPSARRAGAELAGMVRADATLVHNAGIWPTRLALVDGVEAAFATNCLCPLALQEPLLAAGLLSRVLVISAGLMVKGRFDAQRTPTGEDFSAFRTYCTTKLAGAAAMREAARSHPSVDFAVIHPGVVRTDLGAPGGPLGWLLQLVKRAWETPERCAARLVRVLAEPTWQDQPGEAPWYFEETKQPWPAEVSRDSAAVMAAVAARLGASR